MTPDVRVENLCRLMGGDEGKYGISWKEKCEGVFSFSCFEAVVGDATLVLNLLGNGAAMLKVFNNENGEIETIVEPQIHISCSPFGKFFRWLTCGAWPKSPQTWEERANERLRIALHNLYVRAERQQELRFRR